MLHHWREAVSIDITMYPTVKKISVDTLDFRHLQGTGVLERVSQVSFFPSLFKLINTNA